MSTSARRAALSRIMVTPPDHQDSREHQLEGLRAGGGAEWRVVENGGFLRFFEAVQAPRNFRYVASWCSSTHSRGYSQFDSLFLEKGILSGAPSKIDTHLLHVATPLHGPQNHWGSLAPTKERPLSENQMCCVL